MRVWGPMWRAGVGLGVFVVAAGAGALVSCTLVPTLAHADTMRGALTQAYQNNPQLNAQRASVRATDEGVPQALSGYRPRISLSATVGEQFLDSTSKNTSATTGAITYPRSIGNLGTQTYGATYTQTLLNGYGTASRTRQAEQLVSSARETLRLSEQTVLLAAATAYMNLIRDAAILSLQRSNVEVLQEQLRQTQDRFQVGEVTRTDVAQSESRLAAARAQMLTAESNYTTSRSTYRQVIGVEPGRLEPASPVDRLGPGNLQQGVALARAQHPSVTIAMFNVDAAVFQVKIAESSLYPTLNVVGSTQKAYGSTTTLTTIESFSASVQGQLNVPIYQGGSEYSTIRQAKETLQQRRIDLDTQRDQAQQTLVQILGTARSRQGPGPGDPDPGERRRDRAQRRARGGPRRPAHHARRAQCAAGTGQRPGVAGDRAARPCRRLLCGAGRRGRAVGDGAGAAGPDLRPDGALSPGARHLGRGAYA